MEDFLRDSLGIVGESAMQEMPNASFTSVLASIEEEDVINEDVVEEEMRVKDGFVSRRELPPSLQKLEAQRVALLKVGFDSDKEGDDTTKVAQEELCADEMIERQISCDIDAFISQETENCAGIGMHAIQSAEAALPEEEEAPVIGMDGTEQAEEGNNNHEEERVEVEVQADTLYNFNSGKEATEIADSKLNVGAEESELQKEEVCLQCHVLQAPR